MASPGSKARLFVALDLPAGARDELVAWRGRALRGIEDLRPVAPEALHVTLVFLGYLEEGAIARISELLRPLRVDAPVLAATGVKPIPPRRPRLVALDLADEGGRAAALQAAVSGALEAAGLYEPEQRPFWPHVTLARVRKGARLGHIDVPEPPAAPWRAAALTLYRSWLSREGARYEPLYSDRCERRDARA